MNNLYNSISEKFFEIREQYGLTGSALKLFAIISMLVDHTAATIVLKLRYHINFADNENMQYILSRVIFYMRRFGRLAFPIFCFMVVEGYFHTRNLKKYLTRMLMFALISEFPFDFALHHGQSLMAKQNVYWTLLIGLLVIWLVDEIFSGMLPIQLIILIFGMLFAKALRTDYNYHGIFLIELLYIMRYSPFFQSACSGAYLYYYEKLPTPLSSLLLLFYNGKRGRPMKYFFYWFYPAHLMFLGIVTYCIIPYIV